MDLSALGPGMESSTAGFESCFLIWLVNSKVESAWLIKDGLNLIDMSQFRFSNTQQASVGDVENLPQISKDKDLAFQEFKNHLAAIKRMVILMYTKARRGLVRNSDCREIIIRFKAIVPITFGEEGDKFEIGDIGNGWSDWWAGALRIGNIPLGMTYDETVIFKNSLDSLPFEVQGEF